MTKTTEYPAFPFTGSYYSEAEIRDIERRSRKRATESGVLPEEVIRRSQLRAVSPNVTPSRKVVASRTGEAPRTCKGCGEKMQRLPMLQGTDRRVYCTAECRRNAEGARAKARRMAERMVG